jgi:hypothetical protein
MANIPTITHLAVRRGAQSARSGTHHPLTRAKCVGAGVATVTIEHIDGLVGQAGDEVQADGDQRRVPALPFVAGDVLHGASASLANKPGKARLMDVIAAIGLNADRAHMLQAFNQTEHGVRLGGLRHLPQPGQPVLTGISERVNEFDTAGVGI